MNSTTSIEGTFQMLWDCPVCDSTKLLGVDHRYCPNCGAPQEENLRYFPQPGDYVPTKYRGSTPDWECDHCGTPNAADAGHCMSCGGPKGDAESVHVRPSIAAGQGETGADARSDWDLRVAEARAEMLEAAGHGKNRDRLPWWHRWGPKKIFLAVLLAVMAFVATCVLWKKTVTVEPSNHRWERAVSVERYGSHHESAWCSSMPGDAYSVSRSREIHHYDKVPDGEDCRTEPGSTSCSNVDNGNGSFSRVCTTTPSRRVCTTRYRDVPVYADKCSYTVDRWRHQRWHETRGSDRAPYWAEPSVSDCPRLGCTRLGGRRGTYTVTLTEVGDADVHECELDEPLWNEMDPGSQWPAQVRVIGNRLLCETVGAVE